MKTTSFSSVIVAMYGAIICASCFIVIPLGTVPFVLQNMLAIMAGAIFGFPQGAAAVGLFMAAGALGVPVFSGGKGGLAILLGPTGGFILGYFIGAMICGFIAKTPKADECAFEKKKIFRLFIAGLLGFIFSYVPGIIQFMKSTSMPLSTTLATCVIPFIPVDIIKLIIMVPLSAKLRPTAARLMYQDE